MTTNSILTAGAIPRLSRSDQASQFDPNFSPIVQLIRILPVAPAGTGQQQQQQRFRCVLSDGTHFVQGMLATQNNDLVIHQQIVDFSIIRIRDCMCNVIQNKFVIIILSLEIVQRDVPNKIGNPVEVSEKDIQTSNAAQNMNTLRPNHTTHPPNSYSAHSSMNAQQQPLGLKQVPTTTAPTMNNNPYQGGMMNQTNPASAYSSAPIVRSSNTTLPTQHITPIANLNQYQNKWTIKARVTTKSDIRTWSNAKGEGQLFSAELIDSSGMDIRATFFKEAVDRFYALLVVDNVYTFAGGRLKVANLQYNTCKSGYEISFDQNAEIALADDDKLISVNNMYSFIPVSELETRDTGNTVDILAVVKHVSPPSTIMSKKSGQEMFKADLTLVDNSGAEVQCTLWGERAQRADVEYSGCPVVAFRRLRVSDYGGRTLSASQSSIINPNPKGLPAADQLRNWWNNVGRTGGFVSKSLSSTGAGGSGGSGRFPAFEERKYISSIREENLGKNNPDKADWISFKGTFTFIKSDKEGGPWYTACPNTDEPCKNRFKVTPTSDGSYHCDRCNQTYPTCVRKYIFSATVSDDTCTTWVSLFDDQARLLLGGVSADDMYAELQGDNPSAFEGRFARANFSDWVITCKVKQEMTNEEMRVKSSIHSLHPMDYAKEGRALLNAILRK